MSRPGPWASQLYARLYARTGTWGQLDLILQGDPVPPDMLETGERLRSVYLREEERAILAANVREAGPKTKVTWTNDAGETCTVEGWKIHGD